MDINRPGISSANEDLQDLGCQNSYLHINKIHSRVNFTCIYEMYRNQLLCDVVLIAEGVEIRAHKLMLASCSSYFYIKFSKDRNLGLLNRIELENITFGTLSAVLDYLYNSKILITKHNVEDLLAAAYMFVLKDLHKACSDFIKANISHGNCISSSNIARLYQCNELLPIIDDYIGVHFSEVIKHGDILELSYEQILNLIGSDGLYTAEENILECVITWIRSDLPRRKDYIYTLMRSVKIPLISLKDVIQRLEKEQWLILDPGYYEFLGTMSRSYFMEGQAVLSTKPRLSSKLLVAVGVTEEECLSLEMFDFQKNIWLNWPEAFRNCTGSMRTTIHGLNLYCTFNNNYLKFCNISNPTDIIWSDCTPMLNNTGISNIAIHNNLLYSLGHNNTHYEDDDLVINWRQQTTDIFDISKGTWSRVENLSMINFDKGLVPGNGRLYAVGGRSHGGSAFNSVYYYTPDANSWQNAPSMLFHRSSPGVAFFGNNLYVVGGRNGTTYLQQVETLNPDEGHWSRLPDMNVAREAPGVIGILGHLYVIGGFNNVNGHLDSAEVYDAKSNSWSLLPWSMNTGKSHVAVALVDKSQIKY